MYRVFALLLIGAVATAAVAQNNNNPQPSKVAKVTVSFPSAGERAWWWEDARGQPVGAPISFKDKQTSLEVPSDAKGGRLIVEDRSSRNMAAIPYEKAVTKPELTLAESDFKFASMVRVKVVKGDRPVHDVTVTLADSSGRPRRSILLSRGTNGVAEFSRVAHGKLQISVSRSDGKDVHEETLAATRAGEQADPVFTYVVTANVPTVDEAAPATAQTPTKRPEAPRSDGFGTVVLFAIAAAVALAVLIGALKLIQGKNERVAEMMTKMGVQLPGAASAAEPSSTTTTAPAPPIVPEGFCQFCGQKKDANGACGCALPSGSVATSPAFTGEPRLFGLQGSYAGAIFMLDVDVIEIGRQPGNAIVLDQDQTVSRKHAQIARKAGSFVLTDFGSSNGTFVNGTRITGEQALRPGDMVKFGSSEFKFEG